MVATSPPACDWGAAVTANATVVGPPASATGGGGSRSTEIDASVGAATRSAIGWIGGASVAGSGSPSESRASTSSRQEPGTVGVATDRRTLCPARVVRPTGIHVEAGDPSGTVGPPSARATGVHRTANRIAAGKPSFRLVHGTSTTIDEPAATAAPGAGGATRGEPKWRPRSRNETTMPLIVLAMTATLSAQSASDA